MLKRNLGGLRTRKTQGRQVELKLEVTIHNLMICKLRKISAERNRYVPSAFLGRVLISSHQQIRQLLLLFHVVP